MSAGETKRDLPPGWRVYEDKSHRSMGFPAWEIDVADENATGTAHDRADAVDNAWRMFGIPRDEYKAMQRDRRAISALGAMTVVTKPTAIGWKASKFGPSQAEWHEAETLTDAIIAALGESS